jgi:NitT/TauT family transport system substrate-binding protein
MRALIGMLAALLMLAAPAARAETGAVAVAYQYGLTYLPLMVMKEQHLLEQRASAAGLGELAVTYATLGGPGLVNDGLISGSVQFGAVGVPSLVTLWAKTRGNLGIKAVAALSSMPMFLNTVNPAVRSLADLTDQDRIALPTVKVSVQAVTLQMAAAKAFGRDKWNVLDRLTVSMAHPDAMAALLSGRSEITAHFTAVPFQYQELASGKVHRLLDSYDVLGGRATFVLVVASERFRAANPRTYAAFVAALDQAMAWIAAHKREAAALYLEATGSKETLADVLQQLDDPEVEFTTTPRNIGAYAAFMADVGTVKLRAESWKDLTFDNLHGLPGS